MAPSRSGAPHHRSSQASTEILHSADAASYSRHGSRSTSRRPDGIRGEDRREERKDERREERRGEGKSSYNRRSTEDLGSEGITPASTRYTESREVSRSTSRPVDARRDDGRREDIR
jgi:hypothetical protein